MEEPLALPSEAGRSKMGTKSRLKWEDMLDHRCPTCSSSQGFMCVNPDGLAVKYVHPERFKLYEQAQETSKASK
jgi:hypothetical protein